jgi:hypothetical protein
MTRSQLTAFGRWVRKQPRGTKAKIQYATHLAYSTVHAATRKRVSREVAELLAEQTGGAVRWEDIAGARVGNPSTTRDVSP